MDASTTPTPLSSTPMPMAPPPKGGRMRRGIRLLGMSWHVVMSEKSLLALPLISMVSGLALFAGLGGIFWANGTIKAIGEAGSSVAASGDASAFYSQLTPVDYALLGVYYFLAAFITVFFNAAIVAIAMKKLNGEDASIGDGLRMAWKHAGKIAVWALITATVGLILRSLQERAGVIGSIVLSLVGVAWTVVTFFVVPVLLFEEVGAVGGIKRSAQIFKQKWGEQLTGTVAITSLLAIFGFIGVLVGVALVFVSPLLGVPFVVFAILATAALSGAVTGVFNTVLYKYATTGEVGAGFSEADLNAAFFAKKGLKSKTA